MDKVFESTNDIILILDEILQKVMPDNPENSWNQGMRLRDRPDLSYISIFNSRFLLWKIRPNYNSYIEHITITKENLKDTIFNIAIYYNYNYHKLLEIAGIEEESKPIITDKLPSKFYIKCNSQEEADACDKWAENRNLENLINFSFILPEWIYFLVDLDKKEYVPNNSSTVYRNGVTDISVDIELTLKDLGITIESNEENKTIEESTVKEITNDIVVEEPKEPELFKKDDYIVIIESAYEYNQLTPNYCYKQKEHGLSLKPYYDSRGSTTNGFPNIYFANKNIWRYATPLEIEEYNRLGKPFDTSEFNNGSVSIQYFKEFIVRSDDPIDKTVEEVFKNPNDFISEVIPINNSASCIVDRISTYNTPIVNESNKSIYNVDLYGITPEPEI